MSDHHDEEGAVAPDDDIDAELAGLLDDAEVVSHATPVKDVTPAKAGVQGTENSAADQLTEESEEQVESDLDELTTILQRERDEYLDLARRVQADFENYKKRASKQMQEHTERAGEVVITKLLDVLDTIDLALHHEPSGPLEQVASSLRDVLGREGLERISSAGVPFDPVIHDAVAHEDGDGEPEVVEVMRAGYMFRGRVIRPAMVKVKGAS